MVIEHYPLPFVKIKTFGSSALYTMCVGIKQRANFSIKQKEIHIS